MNCVERKIEEKRFGLVPLNKGDRFSRERVCQVFGFVFDRYSVANQRFDATFVEVAAGAAEEAVREVEPSLVRSQPLLEPDVPLADHAAGVSCLLQFLGQRGDISGNAKVGRRETLGSRIVLKPEAMLIHAAHQPGARR